MQYLNSHKYSNCFLHFICKFFGFHLQSDICDKKPIGVISIQNKGNGNYYIGCLCVIPEYQSKGIGTQAFKHIQSFYSDWRKITLITPADKEENIKFYTQKCGFSVASKSMDGNVEVINFHIER